MALSPTGILFYDGRAKPTSVSGTFQAGAQLFFYLSRTTTETNVYADGLMTTPRPQPVFADADGRFPPIYMDPAVIYRYQLYNSANVLLEDIDPYVVAGGSFSAGSAAAPSIAFNTDIDTGFFNPAPNTIGVTTGGVETATFSQGQENVVAPAGAVAQIFVQGNGTTGGDGAIIQYNASDNFRVKHLHPSGTMILGAQGVDQLALTGSAIQGFSPNQAALQDMTPDSGSWTTALTGGFSGSPTGVLNWQRLGKFVTVFALATVSGTSTGINNINFSALPPSITPISGSRICNCWGIINNSVALFHGAATVNSSGSIDLSLAVVNGSNIQYAVSNTFTGSGSKGVAAGWTITYTI